MKPRTLRVWIWLHKWSSLVSMLFLLMLCLTGLPLISHEEIEHWLDPHPELEAVAPGTPRPALEDLVQEALSAQSANHVVPFVFFPGDEPEAVVIATAATIKPPATGDWEGLHFHQFDQRNGKLLGQEPPARGFMYFMLRLHVDMFLHLPGTLFLGAMGLLLIVAVVSGVVVYTPFMRKLDFATIRAARGPRVLWLDLHNLLGIVTLAWVSVVGLTGVISTLAQPAASLWQGTELAEMIAPYKDAPPLTQRVPLDVALATARETAPDMRLVAMHFPGRDSSGDHHYSAIFVGNTPLTSRLIKPALIDAQTGALTDIREMPWYVKVLYLSKPLHFGDYGGLPLKIIWALLTLITIVVLGSGIYLWLRKPGRARAASAPGRGQA
ncbi:MAG: PepSY domain-containing protein [Porticoccaceae bacterium]